MVDTSLLDEEISLDEFWNEDVFSEARWVLRAKKVRVLVDSLKKEETEYGTRGILRFTDYEVLDGDPELAKDCPKNFAWSAKKGRTCAWTHAVKGFKALGLEQPSEAEGRWVTLEVRDVHYGFDEPVPTMIPVEIE